MICMDNAPTPFMHHLPSVHPSSASFPGKSISSKYQVISPSPFFSASVHPSPKYPNNPTPTSPSSPWYVYSQSCHLGSLKVFIKCNTLPGQRALLTPSTRPFLYPLLHPFSP